jgi:RecA/RadA recombinase
MPRKKLSRDQFDSDKEYRDAYMKYEESTIKARGSSSFVSKLKNYPVEYEFNPLSKIVPKRYIKTNTLLDGLLSYEERGIMEGSSVELYGIFGSGKTLICETLAAETEGLTIFIDTEATFDKSHFKALCVARGKDPAEISAKLLLFKPKTWVEQEAIPHILENEMEYNKQVGIEEHPDEFIKIDSIIIDSFMKHYADSEDFHGRERLTSRQQMARAWLHRMFLYAQRHHAILVYTNQVYDRPVDTQFMRADEKLGVRGGRSLEHIGHFRIMLRKARGAIRVARSVDTVGQPLREVPFMLSEKGIEDIPEPAELAKILDRTEAYEEKYVDGQVGSQKAGEKWEKKAKELGLTPEEVQEVRTISNVPQAVEEVQDTGKTT